MIIKKTKEINEYINKLININNEVIDSIDIINTYLGNYSSLINKKNIDKIKSNYSMNDDKAIYFYMLKSLGIEKNDPYIKRIEKDLSFNKITKLDKEIYLNNPFFKNVKPRVYNKQNWSICYDKYMPYELFLCNDVKVNNNFYFSEYTPLGFFDEEFEYLTIKQNDTTWMLISPHEINTMQNLIDKAHGNVLIYGLGLGYYAYMVSLKDSVNNIIVVEKDKNVIDIFNKFIFPFFNQNNKITIINDDAFSYSNNKNNMNDIDYAFIDIYHNVNDGIKTYIDFLHIEDNYKHIEFTYWIEKSLLNSIRRCLITLLIEEYNKFDENYYKNSNNTFDSIIYKLHTLLSNKIISNPNDINELLSDDNIKKTIKSL